MKALGLVPILLLFAQPAFAEKLTFDHRLYPPLKDVLDSDRNEMVDFDNSNPRYVVDRIAIAGQSAENWTEALEIVARAPTRTIRSTADWMQALRREADRLCPNQVRIVAQDANSVTFERRSPDCPAERAPVALYRIVAGSRTLFLLAFLSKGQPSEAAMSQWQALLASAHLD